MLATKLRPPRPRRRLVQRGRLTDRLGGETPRLVLIAAPAGFGKTTLLAQWLTTQQLAVGLAAAVLLDATIVRAVLLPATMKLLGDRNWYLPRPLARLVA